ncbi:MAG: preprotein translocase subunit SecE [Desulfosudaceae bacterium]
MGRQQKKKDPSRKKKKRDDSAAPAAAAPRQNKTSVASRTMAGISARSKSKPAASSSKGGHQSGTGIRAYFYQSVQFLREVRIELKKVNWPSRKQTMGSTAVALVMIMLVSFFLGIVDYGLSNIIKLILG